MPNRINLQTNLPPIINKSNKIEDATVNVGMTNVREEVENLLTPQVIMELIIPTRTPKNHPN